MKLRRQFWLGILVGLSVGSVLRRFRTGGFGQDSIKRMYSGVNRVSWDLEGQGLSHSSLGDQWPAAQWRAVGFPPLRGATDDESQS